MAFREMLEEYGLNPDVYDVDVPSLDELRKPLRPKPSTSKSNNIKTGNSSGKIINLKDYRNQFKSSGKKLRR